MKAASGRAKCPSTTTPAVAGQLPVSTTALARGPDAVLALIGNVGTPTMVRTAPIAVETGTLFFGAFTGAAKILRDDLAGPCRKYIFNVRASYAEEARATLEFFFKSKVPDAAHVLSFDQNDAFGQAGYDGLVAAFKELKGDFNPAPVDPATPVARFRYTRDDAMSVPAQIVAASKYLADLPPARSQWAIVSALLLIGALLAAILLFMIRAPSEAAPLAGATMSTTSTTVTTALAPLPVASASAPAPSESSSADAGAIRSAPSAPRAVAPSRPATPSYVAAPRAVAPAPAPASTGDCSPPFYFDGKKKIFKPGCL